MLQVLQDEGAKVEGEGQQPPDEPVQRDPDPLSGWTPIPAPPGEPPADGEPPPATSPTEPAAAQAVLTAAPAFASDPSSPPPPPAPPRGNRRTLVIALIGVVLLAGGVVTGIALSGASSKNGINTPNASPSPAVSPTVPPPGGLTATAKGVSVTLSWTAPADPKIDVYNIFRNGSLVTTVFVPTTTYTDVTVTPGTTYTYDLVAGQAGTFSTQVPVTVAVPSIPVAEGRVEGDYNVNAKTLTQSGFIDSLPKTFTLGWHFVLKCATGACDVTWTDLFSKTLKGTLRDKNGTYTGGDTGDFNGVCGHVHVSNTTLAITFKVTKASAVGGVWTATKLVGTFAATSPASFGCVSTRATYSFVATGGF